MVSLQLQDHIKSKESGLEDIEFLKKQLIDKDNRVQELLLEKAEIEEKHSREVDEITEAGVNEINELEGKLENFEEKMATILAKHADETTGLRATYEG